MPTLNEGDGSELIIDWKIGLEIELAAPRGLTRYDLAFAIARHYGGEVTQFFHPQVEPSKVSGTPVFNNLTPGFRVVDAEGRLVAECVDDLTLQDDFDKTRPPLDGWYRIVSDETRLIQLLMQQCDPSDSLNDVLQPIAKLFGTKIEIGQGDMVRVADVTGSSVALAAPLPGERERPCELVLPPIESNHLHQIESILSIARSLGFSAPWEGATHIHFDARALESTRTLVNLSRLLWKYDQELIQLMQTNPNCRRLGKWSEGFYNRIQEPGFANLGWGEAIQSLKNFELTKFCNFNLKNIVYQNTEKYTFEIRILPVLLHGREIIEVAGLWQGILHWAIQSQTSQVLPDTFSELLQQLPLSKELFAIWSRRMAALTTA